MYAFHRRLMSSEYGQVLSQQARPVFWGPIPSFYAFIKLKFNH